MINDLNADSLPPIQSDEFLPPISRWTRLGSLVLVGAVAGAIALASAIEYKVSVQTKAIIRPVGELKLIQDPTEGRINNIFVGAVLANSTQVQNELYQAQTKLQSTKANRTVNAPLIIKAAVSPGDISKLQKGQRAQMRVSACPYPDYGTLNGVVSHISEDTIANKHTIPISGATNSFYEVTIIPDKLLLGKGKNQCKIQAGMEGRTDIISRKDTVMKFMLRKTRLITNW
ncbi:MAG: hypothetical protein KI793_05870 [Rivularia sp. (in: Bacteria)]|nr:hypothetical protein [Rivularia sp. MS3]